MTAMRMVAVSTKMAHFRVYATRDSLEMEQNALVTQFPLDGLKQLPLLCLLQIQMSVERAPMTAMSMAFVRTCLEAICAHVPLAILAVARSAVVSPSVTDVLHSHQLMSMSLQILMSVLTWSITVISAVIVLTVTGASTVNVILGTLGTASLVQVCVYMYVFMDWELKEPLICGH